MVRVGGHEDGHHQTNVMVEGHPGDQRLVGVFEIKNAHTQVDATHQVAVGDHDPLGGGGRAGGVLQVEQVVGLVGTKRHGDVTGLDLVCVNPLQGHYLKKGPTKQSTGRVVFTGLLKGFVGNQKFGGAAFQHGHKAVELALVQGRRNQREHHAHSHTGPDGVHRTLILQRQNDGPVALLCSLGQQLGGNSPCPLPNLSGGDHVLPKRLLGAIQKII